MTLLRNLEGGKHYTIVKSFDKNGGQNDMIYYPI